MRISVPSRSATRSATASIPEPKSDIVVVRSVAAKNDSVHPQPAVEGVVSRISLQPVVLTVASRPLGDEPVRRACWRYWDRSV